MKGTTKGTVQTLPTADAPGSIKPIDDEGVKDLAISFTADTKGAKGLAVGDNVEYKATDDVATSIKKLKNTTDKSTGESTKSDSTRDTSDNTLLHQKLGKTTINVEINNLSKRRLSTAFALILGALGAHKFLLGYKKEGYIMMAAFFIGIFLFMVPTIAVIGVAFFEGIKYLTMKDDVFNETYISSRKPWF